MGLAVTNGVGCVIPEPYSRDTCRVSETGVLDVGFICMHPALLLGIRCSQNLSRGFGEESLGVGNQTGQADVKGKLGRGCPSLGD
jgi:hypothetical protein